MSDKSPEYEAAEALFGLRRRPAASEGDGVTQPQPSLPAIEDVLGRWASGEGPGAPASGGEPVGAVARGGAPGAAAGAGVAARAATAVELVVLRDEAGADAVLAVAQSEGWQLREQTERAHLVRASRRWITSTGEEVTYVIDHPGGAQSLRVEGTWAAALAKRLRGWLPCHTEDELFDVVLGVDGPEPEPVACIRVASKLAALRPAQPHARHMAALERLLGHPADAVRRAGIRSAYGCRWPELRALVERRRGVEPRLGAQLEQLRRHLDGEDEGR